MLSLPDFSAKQILFINSQDAKEISFQNDNLLLKKDGIRKQQVPCIKIFAIFIWGECTLTSVIIKKLLSYGIVIFLLKRNFQTYAVIGSETEGNTILRKKQYSNKNSFEIAQKIVDTKIQNQIHILRNTRSKIFCGDEIADVLETRRIKITNTKAIDELMGIEGSCAKSFFSSYFYNIKWKGRKPRTKYDIPNLLLDMGYTFLFHFIDAQLRLYGFDTYVGNLHQEFYKRKSLVCDIIEPCRCIIDKELLKAFNLKQVDENDFEIQKGQYILKYEKGTKYTSIFFKAILKEKSEIFKYIQEYYRASMKESLEFQCYKPQ